MLFTRSTLVVISLALATTAFSVVAFGKKTAALPIKVP
jgi:hypothetical protein